MVPRVALGNHHTSPSAARFFARLAPNATRLRFGWSPSSLPSTLTSTSNRCSRALRSSSMPLGADAAGASSSSHAGVESGASPARGPDPVEGSVLPLAASTECAGVSARGRAGSAGRAAMGGRRGPASLAAGGGGGRERVSGNMDADRCMPQRLRGGEGLSGLCGVEADRCMRSRSTARRGGANGPPKGPPKGPGGSAAWGGGAVGSSPASRSSWSGGGLCGRQPRGGSRSRQSRSSLRRRSHPSPPRCVRDVLANSVPCACVPWVVCRMARGSGVGRRQSGARSRGAGLVGGRRRRRKTGRGVDLGGRDRVGASHRGRHGGREASHGSVFEWRVLDGVLGSLISTHVTGKSVSVCHQRVLQEAAVTTRRRARLCTGHAMAPAARCCCCTCVSPRFCCIHPLLPMMHVVTRFCCMLYVCIIIISTTRGHHCNCVLDCCVLDRCRSNCTTQYRVCI